MDSNQTYMDSNHSSHWKTINIPHDSNVLQKTVWALLNISYAVLLRLSLCCWSYVDALGCICHSVVPFSTAPAGKWRAWGPGREVTQQQHQDGLEGRQQEAGIPVRLSHSWNSSKYKTINICFGNVSRFNKFYDNILGRFLWKSVTDARKNIIHFIIN